MNYFKTNNMTFPSKDLQLWCINIDKLIDVPLQSVTNKYLKSPVLNSHEIEPSVQLFPIDQQPDLVSGLFWTTWIDQIFYYITIDGGVKSFLKKSFNGLNKDVYYDFRKLYNFPQLSTHSGCFDISPFEILSDKMNYIKPSKELLLSGKKFFWGEIKNWLMSIGRYDIIDQMIIALIKDLYERYDKKYDYLVDNLRHLD